MKRRTIIGAGLLAMVSACGFSGACMSYFFLVITPTQQAGELVQATIGELAVGIISAILTYVLIRKGRAEAKAEGTTFTASLFANRWLILGTGAAIFISIIVVILLISTLFPS